MRVDLITRDDLVAFKAELLHQMLELVAQRTSGDTKPWLTDSDVRRLLQVSSKTIQRLRVAGRLSSKKLGRRHYYRREDVERMLGG